MSDRPGRFFPPPDPRPAGIPSWAKVLLCLLVLGPCAALVVMAVEVGRAVGEALGAAFAGAILPDLAAALARALQSFMEAAHFLVGPITHTFGYLL